MRRLQSCVFVLSCALLSTLPQRGAADEPAAPTATEAVQAVLEEGLAARKSEAEPELLLELGDRALALSLAADDAIGIAAAQSLRGWAFAGLERSAEELEAWEASGAGWKALGDGPGQVRATLARSYALALSDPETAQALAESGLALAAAEQGRPVAAAKEVVAAADREMKRVNIPFAGMLSEAGLGLIADRNAGSAVHARALTNMGTTFWYVGNMGEAGRHYREAYAIHERIDPGGAGSAVMLGNLGLVAKMTGDLAQAAEYGEKSLALAEKGGDAARIAWCLNSLASIGLDGGPVPEIEQYIRRAIALLESEAPDDPTLGHAWHDLGHLEELRGRPLEAREAYSRALVLNRKHAPGSLTVAQTLSSIATVAGDLGDHEAARDYLHRALEITESHAPGSPRVADVLMNLAWLAGAVGDYEAGASYSARALAIREEQVPNTGAHVQSLHQYSEYLGGRGEYEKARELNAKARAISREFLGAERDPDWLVESEAWWDARQGRHAEAIALFRELLGRQRPGTRRWAELNTGLASSLKEQGKLDEAIELYSACASWDESLASESWPTANCLNRLGRLEWERGQLGPAEEHLTQAWETIRQMFGAVDGDEGVQALGRNSWRFAAPLARVQAARGRGQDSFATSEQMRAQGLLQLTAERDSGLAGQGGEAWRAKQEAERRKNRAAEAFAEAGATEQRLNAERAELAARGGGAGALAELDDRRAAAAESLERAREEHALARTRFQAALHRLRQAVPALDADSLSLDEARASLPPGSVFVSFLVSDDDTLIYLLWPDAERPLRVFDVPMGGFDLAARIPPLRQLLSPEAIASRGLIGVKALPARRSAPPELVDASRELYRDLLPPPVRQAIAEADRVILAPDGPLWSLPFAALVTNSGDGPSWLGVEKPLSHAPSLTVFALARRGEPRPPGEGDVLVVGDPDFGGSTAAAASAGVTDVVALRGELSWLVGEEGSIRPLPGSRLEAKAIADLYGKPPLLGSAASEAAVRSRIADAEIVHLATHGFVHPTRAMSSGLLLAPPAEAPEIGVTDDDGLLQAWELMSQLRLRADLVVLSACDTGRGENVLSEGIVGLTRAFQAAGARSIVATQWPVSDQASATLMVAFHRGLREGLAKDEALRAAMEQVSEAPRTSHPALWSGFMLVGDPDRAPRARAGQESAATSGS